jgi:hypothetical protein
MDAESLLALDAGICNRKIVRSPIMPKSTVQGRRGPRNSGCCGAPKRRA